MFWLPFIGFLFGGSFGLLFGLLPAAVASYLSNRGVRVRTTQLAATVTLLLQFPALILMLEIITHITLRSPMGRGYLPF